MKVISKTVFTIKQGLIVDQTGSDRKIVQRGFTLLEVIAGLAIIMLLIGGVYGIANGALELGVRSSEARKVAVREMSFSTVMRDTLTKLGPQVKVTVSPTRLTLSGASGIFDVGGNTALADLVSFDFREDGAIRVSHFRQGALISELRLMGEFTGLFWECQDPVSGNWVRDWNVTGDLRPELIRLRTQKGEAESTEVFWIPGYRKEGAAQ